MPTYDFLCPKCRTEFSEIKTIGEYSLGSTSACPSCETKVGNKDRNFAYIRPTFCGTRVENAEYNPGLGQVTKNSKHRAEIARQKGLVEVGNDYNSGESMQKDFEKKKKEELNSNWKDPRDFFLE